MRIIKAAFPQLVISRVSSTRNLDSLSDPSSAGAAAIVATTTAKEKAFDSSGRSMRGMQVVVPAFLSTPDKRNQLVASNNPSCVLHCSCYWCNLSLEK